MDDRYSDKYDRSAAGLDFDDPIRERATNLGKEIADRGPEALLDEVENLLPEQWREQVVNFPITAILLGVGVGIFLGMRKGDEILTAGSALLTAAATQNLNQVLGQAKES